MAQKNAASVAKKWTQNLQAATQQIIDGVNAVTVAPTAVAAQRIDTMKQRFLQAVDSGKVARGLQRVSLQDWQQAMKTKGVNRIQQGASEGQSKVQTFLDDFLPFVNGVSEKIRSMPNATEGDRKARMIANFDAIKNYRRK